VTKKLFEHGPMGAMLSWSDRPNRRIISASVSITTRKRSDIVVAVSMSSPDKSERSPDAPFSEYAPKWAGGIYHQGGLDPIKGEQLPSERDLGILRRSVDPEIVDFRQPTPRRLGWFAASAGFIIAGVLGVVIGPLITGALRNMDGNGPGSSTKTTQLTSGFDNSKTPGQVGLPATGLAIASTAPQPTQLSSPTAGPPIAPTIVQQAKEAPAHLATVGVASEPAPAIRGVTDNEIRFGISAPFTGPAKELGQNMKLGIEAAFNVANAKGGVYGRQLRLIAADDGYEPARTAATMKQLYENDQIFGLVGNVGTPTALVALPYALDRKVLFFGAFTGAGLLRSDPPDRYVFNYRASYAEETAAVVNYLVKVRRLLPEQIAVFAQQDAYGDAGFMGVEKAVRSLRGGNETPILRLNYQRNTVDVDDAVAQLQQGNAQLQQKRHIPIKAVIMVPAYRAAAKFIEKTRNLYPDMIYTSVSFVGSTALADELMLLGKKYATGVIVTQVVPAVDGHSSLVLDYKSALAKYFPGQAPDYVSLEGYVDANVLIAALQRSGPQLDTERLVGTFESLRDLDIGLGTPVTFSRSDHQGVHKVWGTQLDETGHYQPIDLQ
jgi:branched-chain amino acid transport system substrate-binding protein